MRGKFISNAVLCAVITLFVFTCDFKDESDYDPFPVPNEQPNAPPMLHRDQVSPIETASPVTLAYEEPRTVDPSIADPCRLMADYPCGTCDPACRTEGLIDPGSDPDATIDSLTDNPDGPGLIIGTDLIDAAYAWIAHYNDGTVSKIDLRSGDCLARYRVGIYGNGTDSPSRTTVDGKGNAYISNRGGGGWGWGEGSVTKIAGDQRFCVDRNSDGDNTDTSSSCSNVMALNTDECVIWTHGFGAGNYGTRGIVVDFGDHDHYEGYPWVGLTCVNHPSCQNWFYKLDPDSGNVLDSIQIDMPPYGSAIDAEGWIWSTCYGCGDGAIQAFHPETMVKTALISKPRTVCGPGWGYGITVDLSDRVWVGSWYSSSGKPCRYDPLTNSWFAPPGTAIQCAGHRGIAVDMNGYMWSACWEDGTVWKFHSDDGGDQNSWYLGCGPLGVALDPFGKIWVANNSCQRVTRIDPATALRDTFSTGSSLSYTYSDFTGLQRSMRNPRGTWIRLFERCDATPMDGWNEISWDITTPSNSLVTIYGRSSDDPGTISAAPQVTMAIIPPSTPPKDITSIFADAGTYLGKYLEVTVVMEASSDGQSPVFVSLYTTYNCY